MNLNKLRDKAYQCTIAHGWHEENLSDKHFLCLVISELMEAVEADRKGRHANRNLFEYYMNQKARSDDEFIYAFKHGKQRYCRRRTFRCVYPLVGPCRTSWYTYSLFFRICCARGQNIYGEYLLYNFRTYESEIYFDHKHWLCLEANTEVGRHAEDRHPLAHRAKDEI